MLSRAALLWLFSQWQYQHYFWKSQSKFWKWSRFVAQTWITIFSEINDWPSRKTIFWKGVQLDNNKKIQTKKLLPFPNSAPNTVLQYKDWVGCKYSAILTTVLPCNVTLSAVQSINRNVVKHHCQQLPWWHMLAVQLLNTCSTHTKSILCLWTMTLNAFVPNMVHTHTVWRLCRHWRSFSSYANLSSCYDLAPCKMKTTLVQLQCRKKTFITYFTFPSLWEKKACGWPCFSNWSKPMKVASVTMLCFWFDCVWLAAYAVGAVAGAAVSPAVWYHSCSPPSPAACHGPHHNHHAHLQVYKQTVVTALGNILHDKIIIHCQAHL